MDLAASDMRNYQLARQLHLLPQLHDVFTSNALCYPLFYQSLAPAVRQQVRTILLALQRRFSTHVHVTGTTAATAATVARRYSMASMRLVLSFLAFPELPTERAGGVSSFLGAAPIGRPELGTPRMAALPAPAAAPPPSSAEATPQALTPQPPPLNSPGGVERLPVSKKEQEEGTSSASVAAATTTAAAAAVASGGASPVSRPVRTPQLPPNTSAPGVITRALFFVRPTSATTHAERAAPHFGTTVHLYVRMVHPNPLNEESLNPYFGRYGQVDVTPLQRTPLPQCVPYLGEAVADALLQLFPVAEAGDTLYVQDFIIAVDSHQNALHAVRRAYYKELVCIALHDPAADGGCNTHCIADVNAWMRRHPFVWRLRADPRTAAAAAAAAASDAKAAAAAGSGAATVERARAAAERRHRKRARARQRRHERKLKRRSVLGIAPDEDSVGSSATSSSDTDDDAAAGKTEAGHTTKARRSGSSESEHSSSSASSSSSSASSESDKASQQGDAATFVPDVLLDGFPYWTTEDQLKVLLQEHGTVAELRLSVDDLTGAFTGCVLVRMSTAAEALSLSNAVHNTLYRGYRLISGVVNERLDVVALEDGREVRQPCPPDQVPHDVTLNERVWV